MQTTLLMVTQYQETKLPSIEMNTSHALYSKLHHHAIAPMTA